MSKIAFSILLIQSLSLGVFGFAINEHSIATNSSNLKIINDHFTKSNNGLSQYGEKLSSQSFGGDETCIFCLSETEEEEDCRQLPNQDLYRLDCSIYEPNGRTGCFTMITPDSVIRGCVVGLGDKGYEVCLYLGKFCKICHGNDCNNEPLKARDAARW